MCSGRAASWCENSPGTSIITIIVIPVQAGTRQAAEFMKRIPACAGMTG